MSHSRINLVSILGNVFLEENRIRYVPLHKNQENFTNNAGIIFNEYEPAFIKSDVSIKEGHIEFDLLTENKSTRCQIVFNQDSGKPPIHVGLNTQGAAFGIMKFENQKFQFITGEGTLGKIPNTSVIKVKVSVKGSQISLYVNNVKVISGNENILGTAVCIYLHSDTETVLDNIRFSSEKPKVFVVMQFSPEYNELYTDVILPTCNELGLECVRADDIFTNSLIIEDIVASIRESSAIIAEITPDNPNVYWEVGYSHGIGKPTILICDKKREKLPFDLAGQRTLFYDNKIAGKKVIEERLRSHLRNIFSK